jgi:hypothetical protein
MAQRSAKHAPNEKTPEFPGFSATFPHFLRFSSIPDRSRTCNLRLRRPTLYPIELRGRSHNILYEKKPETKSKR